ncbi:MAG: hypothetical protein Q8K21_15885 [Hydrogenophaga sp.]|uniref:hypothetical protein n=1 Tax=Hydrogenophaga sp. TaxID=1904254 RepID=UPI002730B6AB|nr:hypothetical protein [Hydrogenophaga sp.]MDP2165665.1 hypothetical protein [Hydrogenophaga sp.]MDP3476520.1 hypothetical protein [Hydrogenophaga sp.]
MNTQASDRFTKDLDKYLDIFQWMRMNLDHCEIEDLRCGLPAFGPCGRIKGATKKVLKTFHAAFVEKGLCSGDGHWYWEWMKKEQAEAEAFAGIDGRDGEREFDWSGWTEEERELAMRVSDALCDFASYDEVNPDEALTLEEKELMERVAEWLRSDDPSEVAYAHKVAEFGDFDISDMAEEAKAEAEQGHLCTVLDEKAGCQQDEPVVARRI